MAGDQLSLRLKQDDRAVAQYQLCPVPHNSGRHSVAVCTQPLFSPDSPYAEPEEQQAAKNGGLVSQFRALLWQWLRYNFMIGVDHVYLYDRDDSFGQLVPVLCLVLIILSLPCTYYPVLPCTYYPVLCLVLIILSCALYL